jgi:hypothetical protein
MESLEKELFEMEEFKKILEELKTEEEKEALKKNVSSILQNFETNILMPLKKF